ncbi:hypothetical protein QTI66_18260 [Variovorax sp. J22R133]|uniref:surface-adhesin E family protein n=1 Tax=Variovorax brevis TaxID=3053503 RepID=UPI002574D33D|nr:surface-adhesin E family protein [Variovorax sp. J22R133]MDM0114104.1 hypothetical protein [Variovorax sp. J22R133]
MKRWLLLLGLGACATQALAEWLTVTGDPRVATVNTVQVDPVALQVNGDFKTMTLRVNRSQERRNWEGVPYRSYHARVRFDCRVMRAHYVDAIFYMQPLWRGDPHQATDYSSNPKPMLFLDVEPNPTGRIVRAACHSAA